MNKESAIEEWVGYLKGAFKGIVRFAELLALSAVFDAVAKFSENSLVGLLAIVLFFATIGYAAGTVGFGAGYIAGRHFGTGKLYRFLTALFFLIAGAASLALTSQVREAVSEFAAIEQIDR